MPVFYQVPAAMGLVR